MNMKAAGRLPYVIAGVKDLQLAVSAEYVQEILRTPRWHVVPNTPRHIRGVINLRTKEGDLHTVVNLFAEARTAFRESHKEVAIVLTDGRKHLSLTVDSVASVEAIAEETIEDATSAIGSVKSDLLTKVAHRTNDKGIVFLLDAEALLTGHC